MNQRELFFMQPSPEEQVPGDKIEQSSMGLQSTRSRTAAPKDEPPVNDEESIMLWGYQEQSSQDQLAIARDEFFEGRQQKKSSSAPVWLWVIPIVSVCGLLALAALLTRSPVPLRILEGVGWIVFALAMPFVATAMFWLPWLLVMLIGRFIVKTNDLPMPAWLEWPSSSCKK